MQSEQWVVTVNSREKSSCFKLSHCKVAHDRKGTRGTRQLHSADSTVPCRVCTPRKNRCEYTYRGFITLLRYTDSGQLFLICTTAGRRCSACGLMAKSDSIPVDEVNLLLAIVIRDGRQVIILELHQDLRRCQLLRRLMLRGITHCIV